MPRGGISQIGFLFAESALLKTKTNYATETKRTKSEKLQNQTFQTESGMLNVTFNQWDQWAHLGESKHLDKMEEKALSQVATDG